LTLTPGFNSVIGTVAGFPEFGGTDPQDWVSFTIPTGFVMTSYVNANLFRAILRDLPGFKSVRRFRVTSLQREVMPATPILEPRRIMAAGADQRSVSICCR
jgi:hypothetical protein